MFVAYLIAALPVVRNDYLQSVASMKATQKRSLNGQFAKSVVGLVSQLWSLLHHPDLIAPHRMASAG